MGETTVQEPLTMYTTTWCAFCRRLKSQLAAEGIEITEVNIEEDPAAAEFVMSVNGGFQTVPTVLFADGSALTNPSATAVKQRVGELAGTG
jgi:mycoredoxin